MVHIIQNICIEQETSVGQVSLSTRCEATARLSNTQFILIAQERSTYNRKVSKSVEFAKKHLTQKSNCDESPFN